ncbi:hypothetical protein RN001_005676 [Aquatica leii]|uniref:EB domain-containing protein n=1 Tax=Aquatica leii TaxID=1421715 RepID=A0AAN7PC70_9COLE|nr:hypothetical protein RN001_005676 [Aquatica leii]
MRLLILLIIIRLSKVAICLKEIAIGEDCHRNEECRFMKYSKCLNKKCTCNTEFVYSVKLMMCLLKAESISSECLETIQCISTLSSASECHQGMCKCKNSYSYKNNINKCVLDILLVKECEIDSDCHYRGTDEDQFECFLGICKCKMPYVKHQGYCVQNSSWTWTSFTLGDVLPYMLTYAFFYVIR